MCLFLQWHFVQEQTFVLLVVLYTWQQGVYDWCQINTVSSQLHRIDLSLLCCRPTEQIFLMADHLTCHCRKSRGGTSNINNGHSPLLHLKSLVNSLYTACSAKKNVNSQIFPSGVDLKHSECLYSSGIQKNNSKAMLLLLCLLFQC